MLSRVGCGDDMCGSHYVADGLDGMLRDRVVDMWFYNGTHRRGLEPEDRSK